MDMPFDPRLIGTLAYPPMQPDNLSSVPEQTATLPFPNTPVPSVNPRNDLRSIRHQYPFIPIIPFPRIQAGATVFLPTANLAADLYVPAEAVIGYFRGSADFWVSKDGKATIPTGAAATNDIGSVFRPDFGWFYLAGVNQFSVVSANVNCVVQLITLAEDLSGHDVGRAFI